MSRELVTNEATCMSCGHPHGYCTCQKSSHQQETEDFLPLPSMNFERRQDDPPNHDYGSHPVPRGRKDGTSLLAEDDEAQAEVERENLKRLGLISNSEEHEAILAPPRMNCNYEEPAESQHAKQGFSYPMW